MVLRRPLVLAVALVLALLFVVTPRADAEVTETGVGSRVREVFGRSGVPGMVAVVVHRDRVVWAGGEGTATGGSAMTADSAVQVASLTKSFTAVAVLQLAESGRIRLDGSVTEQLDELRMGDPRSARITVRQLLDHTSGLTDADTHYYRMINRGASSPRALVAGLDGQRLTTDPGTRHRYANINYVLAGRLVEVASGMAFPDQLHAEVLVPLGLRETTLDAAAAPAGHNSVFGRWFGRRDTSSALRNDPAGGLVTTADDLGRWLIASNGEGLRPLSTGVRSQLVRTSPASGTYGAGWARDDTLPGWWNHGGNRYTYSAAMLRQPVTGWGVAVVVNGASMSDPAYAAALDLASFVEGGGARVTVPSAVAPDRWALVVVLVGAGLATRGLLHAPHWARRRRGHPLRTVLGLLWLMPPIVLALLLPAVASLLVGGIDMSWSMLTYYSLTPVVAVLALAVGSAAVIVGRVVALRRRR